MNVKMLSEVCFLVENSLLDVVFVEFSVILIVLSSL